MDFTIIYVIISGIVFSGLTILGTYLLKKYNVSTENLFDGIDIGKSIVSFAVKVLETMEIDQTNFDFKTYANMIFDALEFTKSFGDEVTKEEKVVYAVDYINDLCEDFNVTLTEEDLEILNTVVILTFNMYEAIEKNKVKG